MNKRSLIQKALVVVLALTVGLVLAEAPQQTASRVFDRVFAAEFSCSDDLALGQMTEMFEQPFCGRIGDTVTAVNEAWTTEVLHADGYTTAVEWDVYTEFGTTDVRLSSYTDGAYTLVSALFVDSETIILLGFNPVSSKVEGK